MNKLVEELRQLDSLYGIPGEQLVWLAEKAEMRHYEEGDYIFQYGEMMQYMLIVLEGTFEVRIQRDNTYRQIAVFEQGSITGVLPFSRISSVVSDGIVTENTRSLLLHHNHFSEMIKNHYELTELLVHRMTDQVRNLTIMEQQNEKLVALGKLSAGLAHELNNPASAMVRSSSELKQHLSQTPEKFKEVIALRMTGKQVDRINDWLFDRLKHRMEEQLPLLKRTELENNLAEWMERRGVERSYELTETFSEYGIRPDELQSILESVPEAGLEPVLRWVDDVLAAEKMVDEIETAAMRIADLVNSVKTFSHMDRARDPQPVEIGVMIETTLKLLNHKIRKKKIRVDRKLPGKLPQITGVVGELNQVWMNLLDNAIDAAPERGTVGIRARTDGRYLYVYVTDNGAGIPTEHRSRIFEPFFTTKAPGEGTGLGLDIAQKIIRRHQGRIYVDSRPGHTEFEICVPIIS